VSGDLLFLQRPKVDVPEEVPEEARQVYEADGSSIGAGVSLTAVVGLHF
jgi:hypothetical protein